jgi:hypothetical protein
VTGEELSSTASSVTRVMLSHEVNENRKQYRLAIVGSRNFPDETMVRTILHGVLKMWHLVVSGGAPGVDSWAEQVAQTIGLPVCVHRADWEKGRTAGFTRNTTIVRDSDVVIAFWDGKSTGTLDTIEKAKALGKPVGVVLPDGRVLSNMKKAAT